LDNVGIEEESNNYKLKTFILCFVVILSFELENCGDLILLFEFLDIMLSLVMVVFFVIFSL